MVQCNVIPPALGTDAPVARGQRQLTVLDLTATMYWSGLISGSTSSWSHARKGRANTIANSIRPTPETAASRCLRRRLSHGISVRNSSPATTAMTRITSNVCVWSQDAQPPAAPQISVAVLHIPQRTGQRVGDRA